VSDLESLRFSLRRRQGVGIAGAAGCDDGREAGSNTGPNTGKGAKGFHSCSITWLPSAFCSFRAPDSFKLIGALFRSACHRRAKNMAGVTGIAN